VVWVIVDTTLLRDEDGAPMHFVSQIQNVTEQKRAQAELLDQQAYISAVLGATPTGIVTINGARRIISLNPAAEQLFGNTSEEVEGKSIDHLVPSPELDADGNFKRLRHQIAAQARDDAEGAAMIAAL
jgi:PAS domain-containing protein